MHPDLPKLLDIQDKDRRLAELTGHADEIEAEVAALDAALAQLQNDIAAATRTATDVARRRDEAEQKLETQRVQHERRRQRLEQERNPRVAAQLLADVELGRSILTQEESDWMRLADDATAREGAVRQAEERLAELTAEQAPARAELESRRAAVAADVETARAEREESASHLDRALRVRYDRLRRSRKKEVLVPADNATCTACFTAIPRSRIGQLQAEGILIDGCEICGAIIYLAEAVV
jgi:predicted  nucleic acid-binding Zn-ribbon protein